MGRPKKTETPEDTLKAKKNTTSKKKTVVSSEELEDYHELLDYIHFKLFPDDDKNFPFFTKQISKYKKEFNLTYKGMLKTLKYCYEFMGKNKPLEPSLGVIPHYYMQAQNHEEKFSTEAQSYYDLLVYIAKLFGDEDLQQVAWVRALIYKYHYNYNCSYKGMKSTLYYYYYVLDNAIPEKPNLNIIPYYYDEAKEYYIQKVQLQKEGGIQKVPVINIYVDPKKREEYNNNFNKDDTWRSKKNMISIDEIEVDENELID